MPPVDLHHSGLSIKPPFTKPKQGKKEGMRHRREGNAVREVRKGKRRWEEEISQRSRLKAGLKAEKKMEERIKQEVCEIFSWTEGKRKTLEI